jgi:hypothetical protein
MTSRKCTVSQNNNIGLSMYCSLAALFIVCIPSKLFESWTDVILLLGVNQQSTPNHMSHAVFFKYCVGS